MSIGHHHVHRSKPYRLLGLLFAWGVAIGIQAQGDAQLRAKADAHFLKGEYTEAAPLYSQLVSLSPQDHDLNYRYGASSLLGGGDREKATSYLKYAVKGPDVAPLAWYFLGRAGHLTYRFKDALSAFERFRGTADKKTLAAFPVDLLEAQCRNGQRLLNDLKDIEVRSKTEVDAADFFRFYDLGDIGGRIVVLPEELMSALDKKSKERFLVYLPDKGGDIFFSSYGKDGRTGRDIYRTELVNGNFRTPVKVAGYINTDRDEDHPVMAPDGKSFYFCSKGHNSMGGYDVFRTSYDKVNDVFGPPVNMDFAVNTPDDELMYIVDAEGRQACFASGRESRQGMVHVYRVGTEQTPVNITVLKGTYSSQFDAQDRKARIVVEDAVTREVVCDVSTAADGSYVVTMPRSGRYKFTLRGGPGDRTHAGMVEVPRNDGPKAFRQEMTVIDQGGPKLMIKNYFDQALDEDVMALALDEIRRRARLDVTGERPMAAKDASDEPGKGDLMTQAGFTGDISQTDAVRLAQEDATRQAERAKELRADKETAMALSQESLTEAAEAAARSEEWLKKGLAEGETEAGRLAMVEAARERARAQAALIRARAAQGTARTLEEDELAVGASTVQAEKLSSTLQASTAKNDKEATLQALKELKERLDKKAVADRSADAPEKARRAAAAADKEVARHLERAREAREESTGLADRIRRQEQLHDAAKGRKKEELAAELVTWKEQHAAMEGEIAKATERMKNAEAHARIARGQAVLVEALHGTDGPSAPAISDDQRITLGDRIGQVENKVAGISVDERYNALIASELATNSSLLFARFTGGAPLAMVGPRSPGSMPAVIDTPAPTPATVSDRTPAVVPVRQEDPPVTATEVSPSPQPTGRPSSDLASVGHAAAPSEVDEELPLDPEELAFVQANELAELHQARVATKDRQVRDSLDTAIRTLEDRMRETAAQAKAEGAKVDPVETAGTDGSEVDQMPVLVADGKEALVFDPGSSDEELMQQLYPGMLLDQDRVAGSSVSEEDRHLGLQGVVAMAMDSVDAEIARQQARLEREPDSGPVVLPRIERLERLKDLQQQKLDEVASRTPARPPAPEHTDLYASPARDPEAIYSSVVDLRTRNARDAVKERDRDLERLTGMEEQIDSLEQEWEGMSAGKERDKLRDRTDRLMDDHLVLRMEIGQRMAFISKEELKTLQDSALVLEKEVAGKGVGAEDHAVRMADRFEDDARVHLASANALRRQADRMENVMARDSSYRTAYAEELQAMRAMARSITVRHYVLKHHEPGAEPTYPEIEAVLHGVTAPRAITPAAVAEVPPGLVEPVPATSTEPVPANSASAQPPSVPVEVAQGPDPVLTSQTDPAPSPVTTSGPTPAVEPPGTSLQTAVEPPAMAVMATPAPEAAPAPELVVEQSTSERSVVEPVVPPPVRAEDQPGVAAVVPMEASAPTTSQGVQLQMMALRQRSLLAAGAANATKDSADAATGAERERLLRSVERLRTLSDSLQLASLSGSALGDRTMPVHTARPKEHLRVRMHKYYFMSSEEHQVVLDDNDLSSYFELRTEARELEDLARKDSTMAVHQEQGAARSPGVGQQAARQRADSLRRSAEQHRTMARRTDERAEAMLATLPVERAQLVRTLEQKQVLAGSGAGVTAARPDPPAVEPAPPPVVERVVPKPEEVMASAPPAVAPVPAGLRAPLMADEFALRSGAARSGPIPVDAPMPSGVVFKVQVGAFRSRIADDAFGDMTPVAGERTANGLIRYTAGMFTSPEAASQAAGQVRANGYQDAFVVAYLDGQRVSLDKARQAMSTAVPTPSVAVPAPVAAAPSVAPGALAAYPSTAAEVLAQFSPPADAASYYDDPEAAPATQVETVKGLFFTVQVGVYSKPTPLDRLFNISPLNSERTATGKIRYTTGVYLAMEQVKARRDQAIALGVKDAFITAYLNGKRIPMQEAQELLVKFGPTILAAPPADR